MLKVRNNEDQATRIQLQLVSWTQEGPRDVYEATGELIANPPIFTLQPKGSQIVRIGIARPISADRELTYRVFLEELAPASPSQAPSGVRLQLRIGLPVFVLPEQPAQPKLQWAARAEKGAIRLTLRNEGTAHVQVRELKLFPQGSETALASVVTADYVLPGSSRQWLIKPESNRPGGGLRLSAQTDSGAVDVDLAVETP